MSLEFEAGRLNTKIVDQYKQESAIADNKGLFYHNRFLILADQGTVQSHSIPRDQSLHHAIHAYLPELFMRQFAIRIGWAVLAPLIISESSAWLELLDKESTGFYKSLPLFDNACHLAGWYAVIEGTAFARGTILMPDRSRLYLDEWHKADHALGISMLPDSIPRPDKKQEL